MEELKELRMYQIDYTISLSVIGQSTEGEGLLVPLKILVRKEVGVISPSGQPGSSIVCFIYLETGEELRCIGYGISTRPYSIEDNDKVGINLAVGRALGNAALEDDLKAAIVPQIINYLEGTLADLEDQQQETPDPTPYIR